MLKIKKIFLREQNVIFIGKEPFETKYSNIFMMQNGYLIENLTPLLRRWVEEK